MAGPAKKRAQIQNKPPGSSNDSSSGSNATNKTHQKVIPCLDGSRDPTKPIRVPIDYSRPGDMKNLSEFFGMAGWCAARGFDIPDSLPQRPAKFNNLGKECPITLNTFNVAQSPNAVVHQYDISWGQLTDASKRVLVKKLWASKAMAQALGMPQNRWIYDTNKLAWSGIELDRKETRVEVDLDEEEGRKPVPGKSNKHTVFVRYTRRVDFAHLNYFLQGNASWSADCIDTINFLDHVMREWPSQKYTQIKKSFFQRGEQRFDLDDGVEAFKGVFASLRPVLNDKFQKSLSVNVDVANGTFWRAQELIRALEQVFHCKTPILINKFNEAKRNWKESYFRKDLRRFKKVGVTAFHVKDKPTQWTIDEICNMNAVEATFPDPDNAEKQITIYNYFKQKYNINLNPQLPVVKMTKKIRKSPVYLPVDVLKIDENQRFNSKLNEKQTSNMIKFAVTLPKDRWAAVMHGVKLLDWPNDPYMKHYGLQINQNASKVKARVLPSPTVQFGQGSKEATIDARSMIQGRWQLQGRKFAVANVVPITAWGVCVIQGKFAPVVPQVANFFENFIKIYEGHGGQIQAHPNHGKRPWLGPGNLSDGGELVAKAWNGTGAKYNRRPMLLFFIVLDRNVEVYRRIKKSCDIRFGVASQVMQSKHVATASGQYISNICMKVNAKLGGATSVARSVTIPKIAPKAASTPTMVVGADVSHPAPGAGSTEAASFAAITMSNDAQFVRYWAEVQTNGNRVEMVTTQNFNDHFGPMAKRWMMKIGQGRPPKRVLYLRDGVSEGQYAAVLSEEVRDMKEAFMKLGVKEMPKFTVVIAGKRHHIRFFPEAGKGDRNGNPLPGTLVETGCTHPFEFDFYLCSHVAIKGTARPIHYQCILNEGEWQAAELQQFIFEHSYQYVRSTTPVSLHPAIYYAHLAADRSRAHVNESPVSSGKKEAKAKAEQQAAQRSEQKSEQKSSTGSSKNKVEIAPLLQMPTHGGLKDVMWYV